MAKPAYFIDLARKYPWVTVALSVLGIVTVLGIVAAAFLPTAVEYVDIKPTAPLAAGSPDFINALAGATHAVVEIGDAPKIYNNGDEFIPAITASIASAQKTITVSNYIWVRGEFSDKLFEALDAAAKRGVEVRILADAGGSTDLPKEQIKELESLGGKFETFHGVSLTNLNALNRRNHRRSFIIDGKVAYTGGIAFRDEWLGNGHTVGLWRDMMFAFEGPMAQDMQDIFADVWKETTGEVIAGPGHYPLAPATHTSGSATFVEVNSSPSGHFQPVRDMSYLSIASASKRVWITNPYLMPDSKLIDALKERAQAGVDVRILVPGDDTDAGLVKYAGEVNYRPLLEAGVKIYEYNNRIHTKAMTIDGVWSIVGSANFDSRSSALNLEDSIGIADTAFAKELEGAYQDDLMHAKEITLEEWNKRTIFDELRSRFCTLFAKQY